MTPLISSVLAGLLVAGIAFVGFGSLLIAKNLLERLLLGIVAFAAGGLLGGAFFHLLPESLEMNEQALTYALIGLITFFVLDSLLWVYHCHGGHRLHDEHKHHHASCPPEKPVGWLNLAGDALHNLTDGIVIASAFIVNPALGWTTTLAVALHEVPQEIGDFGILIHSGFNRRKALLLNGLVALTVLVGILGVFIAQEYVVGITAYTLPFAAGGFIYMACTNLLSEIKEEESFKRRAVQFVFFLLGLGLLWITREA
ncbi:ZIP family metal transporter [Patescibacteria group bacterium]|jgi:zinc and cadmium transporter|nr:ZIP family metal transporter [Patescibacteria group bacterium]